MQVLIVDDEAPARRRLRALLARHGDVSIEECSDGFAAVDRINTTSFDAVFLDIRMPEKSGFDVIEEIGVARMPPVVFVTAYDAHALRAFEVRVVDYLLKPFDAARLDETLARLRERRSRDDVAGKLAELMKELGGKRTLDRIAVPHDERVLFVAVGEIDWIGAEGNYVRLHTAGCTHLIRGRLQDYESALPRRFARVHRSAIVNLDSVRELRRMFDGDYEVVMRDGTVLAVGRTYREALLRRP